MADTPDLAAAQAAVAKAADSLNGAVHLQASDQSIVYVATSALKAASDKLAADQAVADKASIALDAAMASVAEHQQTIAMLQTAINNLPTDQDADATASAAVEVARTALAAATPEDVPSATAALAAARDVLMKADAVLAADTAAPASLTAANATLLADTATLATCTADKKTADDVVTADKAAVATATSDLAAKQAAETVPLAQDATAVAKATADLAAAQQTRDQILAGATVDQAAAGQPASQAALDKATTALNAANAAPAVSNVVIQHGQDTTGSMRFIDTMTEAQAARLYQAAFGRAPDDAGLAWWNTALQKGASLVDIARGFVASAEFQARYAATDSAGLVTGFYENVLGRAPDASGTAFWTAALDRKTADPAQVLVGFSECIENKAHTPDAQTASVARLYYATLDRAPDAAGLSFWTSKLAAQAATLVDEATALAGSPEFRSHYGPLGDGAFVGQLYENVLGRPADAAGLAAWTEALSHGASRGDVVACFSESAEFKDRFVTNIAQNGIPLA